MHYGTFTPYNGNNSHARYKVVAYHSDALLQDKRVDVTTAIPADLIVGDLVDTTSAKATAPGNIAYVVVEPAQAGAKSIVVADPHHVILSRAGVEFGNMDESMALMALADKGFTFSDYAEVALRTT